jgi:hypothetical protein
MREMTEILPNENQVLEKIPQLLGNEFDCAKRLLDFGVRLLSEKNLHQGSLRHDTVITAIALYTKAMTSFRASIHLCEIGCDRNALPVNRSLFETGVNLAFLIKLRVSLYRFNDNSTAIPKTLVDLHGKKLTTDFRTDLYNAWNILMSEKNVDRYCSTPGVKRAGQRLKKTIDTMERPYVDTIGVDWEKKIKSSNTCSGLSIKDFASSLGSAYRLWHGLVYSSDSQHVHQSDMSEFLECNEANDTFWPRWFTSPDQVRTTLHKAALISLGCIEELNKRFKFGKTAKAKIHEFGEELRSWNL